jgi:ADP-dependent NAD(P)H-hydrate dehydratase / NAD(P)H-hydrate epimerase
LELSNLYTNTLSANERSAWLGLLQREPEEHKAQAGRLTVIGGNHGMHGAAFLAGRTALYAGAGWIILGLVAPNSPPFDPLHPELMCINSKLNTNELKAHLLNSQTICIGPGLGQDEQAKEWLEFVLTLGVRLVLDADALNLIASDNSLRVLLSSRGDPTLTVITPHPGEAARLLQVDTQVIQQDRLKSAEQLSRIFSSLVVLKGQGTWCVAPRELGLAPIQCLYGNAGMGSAGMGDALTGLLGALSAQGVAHHLSLWQASVLAVDLHARAGDVLSKMELGEAFDSAIKYDFDDVGYQNAPALIGLHAFELAPVIRRILHLTLNQKSKHV